jgi:glycosyltransferase involved in cell wall biosynthesis
MRLLLVNEASMLQSGLGKIGKVILEGLQERGFEVAELALGVPFKYTDQWKVYPNMPQKDSPDMELFNNYPMAKYGSWRFEQICLDFKPDYVMCINDPHTIDFIIHSPFKNYYRSILMPTIDSLPLQAKWHANLKMADKLLFYSYWAKNNAGLDGEYVGFPISDGFYPADRDILRTVHGIPEDWKIVTSVFKNQPRKRVDKLIEAAKIVCARDSKVMFHLHTQIPPTKEHWDIPDMILQSRLENRILLTYACVGCSSFDLSTHKGICKYCTKCGKRASYLKNERIQLPDESLNEIYNLSDLYVQFATAEGACVPIAEALATDTPVLCPFSTAMADYSGYNAENMPHTMEYHPSWKSERININAEETAEKILRMLNRGPSLFEPEYKSAANFSSVNFIDRLVKVIESVPKNDSWDSPKREKEIPTNDIELEKLNEYFEYLESDSDWTAADIISRFANDPAGVGFPIPRLTTKQFLGDSYNYIKSFNTIEEQRCKQQSITKE